MDRIGQVVTEVAMKANHRPLRTAGGSPNEADVKEEIDRILREEMMRAGSEITVDRMKRAGIPKRFWSAEMQHPDQVRKELRAPYIAAWGYVQKIHTSIEEGKGMIFFGGVGTGKTTLAVAVMKEAMKTGASARFIPMVQLIDALMTMSRAERTEFEREIARTKLLVLDDLGAESTQEWVLNKIDSIITNRYNNMLPILATTNIDIRTKAVEKYNSRVLDRLISTCAVVQFAGSSMR